MRKTQKTKQPQAREGRPTFRENGKGRYKAKRKVAQNGKGKTWGEMRKERLNG